MSIAAVDGPRLRMSAGGTLYESRHRVHDEAPLIDFGRSLCLINR
jgi:hypothetical protein